MLEFRQAIARDHPELMAQAGVTASDQIRVAIGKLAAHVGFRPILVTDQLDALLEELYLFI